MTDTHLSVFEAAREANKAKARLVESVSQTRAQLQPSVIMKRVRKNARDVVDEAINSSKKRAAKNLIPLIGAVAGVGLLLVAKPILNTLKPKPETNDDQ
jgi:2-phosphoglycerate kinase